MGKTPLATLAILAFGLLQANPSASEQIPVERYYKGIGVGLEVIRPESVVVAVPEGGKLLMVPNVNGKFDNLIKISSVPLPETPAGLAGLQPNLVILEINNIPVKKIGIDGLVAKIRNTNLGESVWLKLGKLTKDGVEAQNGEVGIPVTMIDSFGVYLEKSPDGRTHSLE